MTKKSMKIKSQIFFRLKIINKTRLTKILPRLLLIYLNICRITIKGRLGFMAPQHNPNGPKCNMKIEFKA